LVGFSVWHYLELLRLVDALALSVSKQAVSHATLGE